MGMMYEVYGYTVTAEKSWGVKTGSNSGLNSAWAQCEFLPPASAVEVIESEPSVCVSVCLSVNTLTAKPFDLWPWFWVWKLTLTLAEFFFIEGWPLSRIFLYWRMAFEIFFPGEWPSKFFFSIFSAPSQIINGRPLSGCRQINIHC